MPDIEERLRFLEALSAHQTFANIKNTKPTSTTSTAAKEQNEHEEKEENQQSRNAIQHPGALFNETGLQQRLADFLKHDTNFLAQRKLILHQEALQLQQRPGAGKHLQGIDGFEGKDVLLEADSGGQDELGRLLRWPQYSDPRLGAAIQRHQNALLLAANKRESRTKKNKNKNKKKSPITMPLWAALFASSASKQSNAQKKSLMDPSYTLHLARLAVIDEQPERVLQLLSTGLASPSVLRKQSLRSQVNLLFLHALDKGYEEVCVFLLDAGFPASLFTPIFAAKSNPRRFPSYFLVAVAMRRERLVHWCLSRNETTPALLNRAWFNGIRPLAVAQWTGSFGTTQALLDAGAAADRSISYLTYLRCRSYFLSPSNNSNSSETEASDGFHELTLGASLSSNWSTSASTQAMPLLHSHSQQQQQQPHRSRLKRSRLSPLDFACAAGKTESARRILQHMSDDCLRQDDFCLLLLPEASIAVAMLKRCPGLAVKQRDWQGNTPLHVAALAGRIDLMAVYLQHGHCPVDSLNGNHSTPLHVAASVPNRAAVQFLISHGADCSIIDGQGMTALQVARRAGISSEELIDFFHAADTLNQTTAILREALNPQTQEGSAAVCPSSNSNSNNSYQDQKPQKKRRLLIQKLFGKWRK